MTDVHSPFADEALPPVYLAPMAGFTDAPFRLLCREQGCGHTVTEMVSAKGLLFGSARTGALLDTLPGEGRVTVQLFGRDPAALAEAARRIEGERGAALEAIDLNFGCPAPKITGNGEGSALMREPALCGRIVAAVAAAVRVPVTAKLRKGFDAAHENAVEVARICADSGAAMLTVHGRTREQRYGGLADWGCVAAVAAAVRVPVIGNGDIASGVQALRRLSESGCAGVMVGRRSAARHIRRRTRRRARRWRCATRAWPPHTGASARSSSCASILRATSAGGARPRRCAQGCKRRARSARSRKYCLTPAPRNNIMRKRIRKTPAPGGGCA